jgi:hypothetical protein
MGAFSSCHEKLAVMATNQRDVHADQNGDTVGISSPISLTLRLTSPLHSHDCWDPGSFYAGREDKMPDTSQHDE